MSQTIKTNQDITKVSYNVGYQLYKQLTVQEVTDDVAKWIDAFVKYLPRNPYILEIGSATGRDAHYLRNKGCKLMTTDVIHSALADLKDQRFATEYYDFRNDIPKHWHNKFNGLFANGVLLHATQNQCETFLQNVKKIFKNKGIVALSFKNGIGNEISKEKINAPKFYQYYSKDQLQQLLTYQGYNIIYLDFDMANKWIRIIATTYTYEKTTARSTKVS